MSWLITPRNTLPLATGGDTVADVFIDGRMYRVHTFTTVGTSTLTVLNGGSFEYLIVAGGGAGGANTTGGGGGGGGAGGVLQGSTSLTPGTFTVTVGAGGIGVADQNVQAQNGQSSTLQTPSGNLTAIGGGGGATFVFKNGRNGGSGGGSYPNKIIGQGTSGQGYRGRIGDQLANGGGGGGAGEDGGFVTILGGIGVLSSITGSEKGYGGGGGGHFDRNVRAGGGGLGATNTTPATSGAPNTGGGGGAGRNESGVQKPGDGGSGVVIIRCQI